MGTTRIEQSIEDIYEFVENCKMQPLSSTKVIVPKDELFDLLDELRMKAPEEIKRYKKVIANRDAILADAENKVAAMMEEARAKTETLINESEIMQQAYYQANSVVTQATEEANRMLTQASQEADQIRLNALLYTHDLLQAAEISLENAYLASMDHYRGLTESLKANLDIVKANRAELGVESILNPSEPATPEEQVDELLDKIEAEKNKEDFSYEEN